MTGTLLALAILAAVPQENPVPTVGDSVEVRFVDVELRAAVQALSRYLDRPVLFAGLPGVRITLETPRLVGRSQVHPLLRALLESHNFELVQDSSHYRVRQRESPPVSASAPISAGPASAELRLTVIRLRHARAADVAATLSMLYGAAGVAAGGAGRPGTLAEELRRNLVPPAGMQAAARASGETRGAVLEGSVTIMPDPSTNALLIRATQRDADLLAHAVRELDLRPLQVLIEVLIVEARKDHVVSWGLGLNLPSTEVGDRNTIVQATQIGGGLGDLVLRVLNMGSVELNAELRAGATRGDVNILSRPVLLASNNQDARFLVGTQRPFVQVSRTLPTDQGARDQVVQYKDVGTRLSVRPTISADGYVTLEVVQEVSNATSEQAFDAPVIATREAATQVTVKDGQTIVLGGLADRQNDASNGGVPFLSDLPLLGALFGRQTRRNTQTELFLLLTPRILRTDEEVDEATVRYRERIAESERP